MLLHGGGYYIERKSQVLFLYPSNYWGREFHKVGYLIQKVLILLDGSTLFLCKLLSLESYYVLSFLLVNYYKVVPKLLFIAVYTFNPDILTTQEPMSPRYVPCLYSLQLKWQDIIIQNCNQPPYGSCKP